MQLQRNYSAEQHVCWEAGSTQQAPAAGPVWANSVDAALQ
jgi:hypothetical protein